MLSVIGILLSLIVLITFAWRNVTVLVLAPLCATLAVLIDGKRPLLAAFTQIYMTNVGQFVADYFPIFLLGALFGKLMEDSGAAATISAVIVRSLGTQRAILAVVLSCAVLTYGGVSLFVVVFTVFPMARSLFRQADLPRRLIPATIALGSFTFTMTALPGTIQIQNQIPAQFFGTTGWAAPGLGVIGGAIMLCAGISWLQSCARRARLRGERFDRAALAECAPDNTHHTVPGTSTENADGNRNAVITTKKAVAAFAPIVVVMLLSFALSQWWIPSWEADYLTQAEYGNTTLSRVTNLWSTITALTVAILLSILLHFRSFQQIQKSLTAGAGSSVLPVFNTAFEYGYGSTIRVLSGFSVVQLFVTGIAPGQPLIAEAVAVNILAGITGSASGGLSIALRALGNTFLERGETAGISPDLLHRVASMSCGCLDSLPHNGALITLLLICGMTHRQSYRDVAVVTIVIPLCATACVVALGIRFGSF